MRTNRFLGWKACAYAYAAVIAVGIAYLLFRLPFEASEIAGNLVWLHSAPSALAMVGQVVTGDVSGSGFLRPISDASTKLLFDLSGGQQFLVYRSLHTGLVALLLVLLVRLGRVHTATSCGAAVVAVLVLVGMHPFHEAVRETELNIKLIIPACCFAALALSTSEHRWWKDAAAGLLSIYAAFANELGLLVPAAIVVAYVLGFRGVSARGLLVALTVLALYLYLRFFQWDIGTPSLMERSSGFGLRIRGPDELRAMFENNPLPFYAYNIMASFLSVLLSEPRGGGFVFVAQVLNSNVQPGLALEVVISVLTTGLLIWYTVHRFPRWLRRDLSYDDSVFLVAIAMIAANAVISFPYVKDVTMSTGSSFYALALLCAMAGLISQLDGRRLAGARALLFTGLLLAVSAGWAVRAVGFAADMRRSASKAQNDWVGVLDTLDEQRMAQPGAAEFMQRFRDEMLTMPVPKAYREPRWAQRWLDPLH